MTSKLPTLDSLLRGLAFAGLCGLAGVAVAANAPATPTKTAKKPAAAHSHSTKKAPAKAVAAAPAGPAEATPEQIAAAEKVYYGAYQCEFNQKVDIEKNARHAAYVDVRSGKSAWLMKPVLSSTGAIRLEDVKGETLMVQISSKSMLLNVKTAHRIVDDCTSPEQRESIESAKVAKAAGSTTDAAPLLQAPSSTPAAGTVAAAMAPADAASAAK